MNIPLFCSSSGRKSLALERATEQTRTDKSQMIRFHVAHDPEDEASWEEMKQRMGPPRPSSRLVAFEYEVSAGRRTNQFQ